MRTHCRNTSRELAKGYHRSAPLIAPRQLKRIETAWTSQTRGLISVRLALLEPAVFPYVVCSIERGIHRDIELNDGVAFKHKNKKLALYKFMDSPPGVEGPAIKVRECLAFDLSQFRADEIDITYVSKDGHEEQIARLVKYGHLFLLSAGSSKHSAVVDVTMSVSSISRFVFIGGAVKSGTTWVEKLLNAHPELFMTGENHLFSWPPEDAVRSLFDQNQHPYFYSLVPTPKAGHLYAGMFRWGFACVLLSQYKAISDIAVLGDKSPTYSQHVAQILSLFPNARYIHCVRHPLDVAVARMFHESNLLNDSPELSAIPLRYRSRVASFVRIPIKKGEMFREPALLRWCLDEWINANVALQDFNTKRSDRILIVRYEDLASNGTSQIGKILRFLGVRVDRALIRKCKIESHFTKLSGGRPPGEENVRSFYRKGIVGDYANYLSASQIRLALSYLSQKSSTGSILNSYIPSQGHRSGCR
jgi:hypothetical protein